MKQFNKNEQLKFWKGHEESFKGDVISEVILSLSRKYIGKNAIDIGAGSGALFEHFHNRFKKKKILAVDLVPKNSKIIEGDCTNLKYTNNSFDTLFSTDVIEHLSDEDLNKCLNEANRVLKKNGYGMYTTINNEKLNNSIVTCPECGVKFHRWGHCQVFTESRIRKLFKMHGFKIVKVRKINLDLLSKFGILAKIFYFLKLEKVMKFKFLTSDLFFIVNKIKDI